MRWKTWAVICGAVVAAGAAIVGLLSDRDYLPAVYLAQVNPGHNDVRVTFARWSPVLRRLSISAKITSPCAGAVTVNATQVRLSDTAHNWHPLPASPLQSGDSASFLFRVDYRTIKLWQESRQQLALEIPVTTSCGGAVYKVALAARGAEPAVDIRRKAP
jgi:hypothetical protein